MDPARERLRFLLETVALEADHLLGTDSRLFAEPFTPERAAQLRGDPLSAERLDAFSARFARLQDTAGDKLLPALLICLGEPLGSVLDNLDRAAGLGLLTATSDDWIAARTLRNRMVHEYIRLPEVLAQAVNEAHATIPMLTSFAQACHAYAAARGLVAGQEVVIARAGRPVARLTALQPARPPRQLGALAGLYAVPEDWDAPLPADVVARFGGGGDT